MPALTTAISSFPKCSHGPRNGCFDSSRIRAVSLDCKASPPGSLDRRNRVGGSVRSSTRRSALSSAPSFARRLAAAAPMPREPPKTMAIFPVSPRFSFTGISVVDRSVHKWGARQPALGSPCLAGGRKRSISNIWRVRPRRLASHPRAGAELKYLASSSAKKAAAFAAVDGDGRLLRICLHPRGYAFHQALEKPWARFAPQASQAPVSAAPNSQTELTPMHPSARTLSSSAMRPNKSASIPA